MAPWRGSCWMFSLSPSPSSSFSPSFRRARPAAAWRSRHPERCHRPLSRRHFALSRDDDDDDDDVNDSADEEEEKWSDLLEQFDREAAVIADKARNKIVIPPHKVATLERALAGGRRTFKLNDLANDLGLERRDVTAWMKQNQHRQKELAKKYPQEQFRGDDVDEGEDDEVVGLLSNRAKETVRRDKLHDVKAPVKGKKGGSGGMPAYKGFKKTRLGASNIATLEKIWETGNHYPDDMTIQGIRDATKLPASKIVKWFKEKRDGARNQRHRDARNRQAEKEGFYGGRHREGRGGYGKQNRRKQRDVVEDWGDDYY